MSYQYEIPELAANATGVDGMLTQLATAVPLFPPLMLSFIWFVIFIVGYNKQRADTGTGNAPAWATLASICCMMFAMIMSNIAGFIDIATLTITVVITIISGTWLITSKSQ